MRIITVVLLALAISACGGGNFYWAHPQKPPQSFDVDATYCNNEGQKARFKMQQDLAGESYVETAADNAYEETFENCMILNGWKKVKE